MQDVWEHTSLRGAGDSWHEALPRNCLKAKLLKDDGRAAMQSLVCQSSL